MDCCSAKSPNARRRRCLTCGTITIADWRGSGNFCKLRVKRKSRAANLNGRQMMRNEEGSHPEYFDQLCALAAGGHLSEGEFVELQDHLAECARCRLASGEFFDLVHNKLPLADPEVTGSGMPAVIMAEHSSYRERFLARARRQGLAVSHPSWQDRFRNQLAMPWWPRLR